MGVRWLRLRLRVRARAWLWSCRRRTSWCKLSLGLGSRLRLRLRQLRSRSLRRCRRRRRRPPLRPTPHSLSPSPHHSPQPRPCRLHRRTRTSHRIHRRFVSYRIVSSVRSFDNSSSHLLNSRVVWFRVSCIEILHLVDRKEVGCWQGRRYFPVPVQFSSVPFRCVQFGSVQNCPSKKKKRTFQPTARKAKQKMNRFPRGAQRRINCCHPPGPSPPHAAQRRTSPKASGNGQPTGRGPGRNAAQRTAHARPRHHACMQGRLPIGGTHASRRLLFLYSWGDR
ncbi:hypothetical protein BDV95DRAFT_51650 [Massariosphaeria phaeospora]|uniref:Uncharacterized protein n=1 Tax=Massariosphaeria phaeospora TaxID=100035 RepID=A0A7C8I8S0_9PLEO|nr:hypothetical protein BDV95DRAFT_51650 [Massariosphaeria phaeospora]